MDDNSIRKSQLRLLVINLLLLLICAGSLAVVIGVYYFTRQPKAQQTSRVTFMLRPTLTPTPPAAGTSTPSATITPRPTSSATITLTPTWSPTPGNTSTLTPFPSLTPAAALVYEDAYSVAPFTVELAERMVQLAQSIPAGVLPKTDESNRKVYYETYQYPIFTINEALLRLPDDPLAESWRWMLAYNLALTGDAKAGDLFAQLIADNLNRDQVDLSELYAWFGIQEPRLQFFMVETPAPPDALSSYVIELHSQAGSAFIWLLQKSNAFQAFPLYTVFDFVHPRTSSWILAELDGDQSDGDELAIYFSSLAGETMLQPPRVFNLSRSDPVEMVFIPDKDIFQIGMEYANYWALKSVPGGKNELEFSTTVFPVCPIRIERSYRWTGVFFKVVSTTIGFEKLPVDIAPCELALDSALHFWGAETAVKLMETLLPLWPPKTDVEGKPYPEDGLDGFRYRMGIYKALAEDRQGAIELLNQVSTEPSILTSRWIQPAQKFLAAYQKPEDLYLACQFATYCDPEIAIRALAQRIPAGQDALRYLQDWRVQPVASGFFDFEQDGESERWFTVRNSPRETPGFWILARNGLYHTALMVGRVESQRPEIAVLDKAYIADEGLQYEPAILLDARIPFSMQRFPDTEQAFLVDVPLRKEFPSRFFVPLASYRQALFSGASPELIQGQLKNLKEFPGLLCKTTWSCDEYYYLLGLASEMAKDGKAAADAYQYLWLNYSKSPYTQLARLKLVKAATPLPTLTVTPFFSATPAPETSTPYLTATIGTPTVTHTAGTPTPSLTPSPTVTGTPPTATQTKSTTITPTPTNTIIIYTTSTYTPTPHPYPTPYPTSAS